MKLKHGIRIKYHTGTTNTINRLTKANGRMSGFSNDREANFKRILPSAMKKLLADGLFEPDGDSYKITKKGIERLKEFDKL